jgi:hypothetical protein
MSQLQERHQELRPECRQFGLDDGYPDGAAFAEDRLTAGTLALRDRGGSLVRFGVVFCAGACRIVPSRSGWPVTNTPRPRAPFVPSPPHPPTPLPFLFPCPVLSCPVLRPPPSFCRHRGLQFTLRQYVKRGCHNSLRPAMWARILCVEPEDAQRLRMAALKADVRRRGFATDGFFVGDAQAVCDDHNFFPFLELLQVCGPFV